MSGIDTENDYFITAGEKAYQAILQKIITGDFSPGTRLVRRPLAEMLGMSPIPVLEAMKRLEQDGLVEYRAQWGSIVTIPTLDRVKDMFMMREAIECQVARILSKTATEDQARTLKEIASELDRVRYESEDALYVTDFHYKLHMTMAEYAGYPSLVAGLRRANFFWLLCGAVRSRRKRSTLERDWHSRLIDTILAGDPENADRAMREHIKDSFIPVIEDMQAAGTV